MFVKRRTHEYKQNGGFLSEGLRFVTWIDFLILYFIFLYTQGFDKIKNGDIEMEYFVLKVNKSRRDNNYNKQTGTSTLSQESVVFSALSCSKESKAKADYYIIFLSLSIYFLSQTRDFFVNRIKIQINHAASVFLSLNY